MENLLNREMALTWGAHYVESVPEKCNVRDDYAYVEMWFCKAGRDEEHEQSLFKATCSYSGEKWEVENYSISGFDDFHNDIKTALCETVCEYLDKYHR